MRKLTQCIHMLKLPQLHSANFLNNERCRYIGRGKHNLKGIYFQHIRPGSRGCYSTCRVYQIKFRCKILQYRQQKSERRFLLTKAQLSQIAGTLKEFLFTSDYLFFRGEYNFRHTTFYLQRLRHLISFAELHQFLVLYCQFSFL